jgi:hypothetical protein
MRDYSLEMYASRPAREAEKYVTTRFPSGSVGLAAPGDCRTAVCVQYDTHFNLEGISSDLQSRLDVQSFEHVVFARLQHGAYRDGVRFANGKELSLQILGPGVGVTLAPALKSGEPRRVKAFVQRQDVCELEPAE